MRKVVLMAMGIALIGSAALAQSNQVLSRNAVGYVKVDTLSSNNVIAALNFYAFSNTIGGIFGTQLTGGNNFQASDQVIKWDPVSKSYIIFWKTPTQQWRQYPEVVATTNVLNPGEAFWIKNSHSSNQAVYLMGEVPDSFSAPTVEVDLLTNMNFVSYGYPVERAISNLTLTAAKSGGNFQSADNIIMWNPVAKAYKIYWRSPVGWRLYPETSNTMDRIRPGEGFWYKHLSNTFTWAETKPYTWP